MSLPAFADPVFQSQATFRAIMRAMSRPGEIVAAGAGLNPPPPLGAAAAAALLTLCDFETPLWLAPAFAGGEIAAWLKFHTGAPEASRDRAAFALVDETAMAMASFVWGTAEYPDRSTTLVLPVDRLTDEGELSLSGPGISGSRRFDFAPRRADFLEQWRINGAAFPLGIDLILASVDRLAALPRTTRIAEVA